MDKYKISIDRWGSKYWILNDKYHRADGPAAEYGDGSKSWFVDGVRHREDGPAAEWDDGDRWWFLNGEELTEEDYKRRMDAEKI